MFYHLTLQQPTGISLCVPGSFTSSERHSELVLLRGPRFLELWILHPEERKLKCVSKQELYGEILSMKPVRPPGAERDYLVASSKEGDTLIYIYDFRKRVFIKVYTSCVQARRSFQLIGHFVATDPRGRAFIMGAKENIKVVHSVKMLDQNNLDVSFIPFENNENIRKGVTYDIVFLYDVLDNNIVSFASTEIVFKESKTEKKHFNEIFEETTPEQSINFFDINLRTRKVELKRSEFLEHKSNFLMEVPAGNIGPGGVLIFSLNCVVYKRGECNKRCPIPRRFTENTMSLQRPIIFINCTLYMNRGLFYYLAQTELGDIFKITLAATENFIELQMQYFCSLPLATSLCILEPDCLFVAYESGDHALYPMSNLSQCDDPIFSSALGLKDHETFFFWPSATSSLEHLQVIPSLSPMVNMPVVQPSSLFAVCGSGGSYILKSIAQKLQICSEAEIKVDDCLQKKVTAVQDLNILWSNLHAVYLRMRDFIILSYAEKTAVFELLNGTLSRVKIPDISTSSNTLACRALRNEIVVQITSQGIHTSIPESKWRPPQNKRVEACAMNYVQAILLLDDKSLHYVNIGEHAQLTIHPDTIKNVEKARCILLSSSMGPADFALIGTYNAIFVISLSPNNLFQCVHKLENLIHPVGSLLLCHIGHQEPGKLKILAGLLNGDLLVTHLDKSTGTFGNTEKYHLGNKPVQLFDCGETVMILTNYPWLYLLDNQKVVLKRFYAGIVETACNFREPNKFLLFSPPILRLVYVADLNAEAEFKSLVSFKFAPEKLVANPKTKFLFYTQPLEEQEDPDDPAPQGRIESSLLHVFNPFHPYQHFCVRLQEAISCSIAFTKDSDPIMLISSKKASDPSKGVLQMLKLSIDEEGKLLINQLDRIELEAVPTTMEPFSAMVLVAIGNEIRIFSCTKSNEDDEDSSTKPKLQEECKYVCAPTCIESISTNGENILVKDSEAGFLIVKHSIEDKSKLEVFAYDSDPLSICCFFGPSSIARTDQFGNITIAKYSGLKDDEPNTEEELHETLRFTNDGPQPATMAHFCVGEVVRSMQMASIFHGGQPVLLYSTLSGSIGIIAQLQIPLVSPSSDKDDDEDKAFEVGRSLSQKRKEENENLLSKLERFMLLQDPVYCEDHLSFRAPHNSLEKIINGDLCEQYSNLGADAQDQFARSIQMTPEEIVLRLVEIRSNFLF